MYVTNNLGSPVYASSISTTGTSNLEVQGQLTVSESIFTNGRVDVGTIIYATFRLNSNISYNSTRTEIYPMFNAFTMDMNYTHMNNMDQLPMVVAASNIYNSATGQIVVPVTGFYALQVQGVFENDPNKTDAKNGVYFYFQSFPNPTARVAAAIAEDGMLSTTHVAFLLGGDRFLPVFYSNDPNAKLLASNGETYISFVLLATASTASHGYARTPISY